MLSWPASLALLLAVNSLSSEPLEVRPAAPSGLSVGLVSRRPFCRGSFVVLDHRLEEFVREAPGRRLIAARGSRTDGPVDQGVARLTALLRADAVALIAVRDDGTPVFVIEVPDLPRAQIELWNDVERLLVE